MHSHLHHKWIESAVWCCNLAKNDLLLLAYCSLFFKFQKYRRTWLGVAIILIKRLRVDQGLKSVIPHFSQDRYPPSINELTHDSAFIHAWDNDGNWKFSLNLNLKLNSKGSLLTQVKRKHELWLYCCWYNKKSWVRLGTERAQLLHS